MGLRATTSQSILLTGLLFGFGQAVAPPASAENVSSHSGATGVLLVEVTPGPVKLEPESIRVAIEKELGLPSQSTPERPYFGRVQVQGIAGPAVIVRYESADGTTKLERRMALPVDESRRTLVVSWVVGNLVRNEAVDILAGMSKQVPTDSGAVSEPASRVPDAPEPEPMASVPTAQGAQNTSPQGQEKPRGSVAATGAVVPTRTPAGATNAKRKDPDLGHTRVIHLAFVSPKLALHRDADKHRYHLSLGGLYNHVGAVDGIGLGWLVDHVEYGSKGALISGIWNQSSDYRGAIVGGVGVRSTGSLEGVEVGGITTFRLGCVQGAQVTGAIATAASQCQPSQRANLRLGAWGMRGLQLGGVVAHVGSGLQGGQIGGAIAILAERSEGIQLAGGVALTQADFRGNQISGAANIGRGNVSGAQLSGAANILGGDLRGAQITGGVNLARDVDGLQLATVNLGRDISGVQLGLVNVARKNRGISLGLFNWSDGARLQPTYFYRSPGSHNFGYRSISGHAIGSISFGYDHGRDIGRTRFAIGVRPEFGRIAPSLEFGYGWVLEHMSNGPTDRAHELELIGAMSVEIVRKVLGVYGGGGVTLPVAGVVPIEPSGVGMVGITLL